MLAGTDVRRVVVLKHMLTSDVVNSFRYIWQLQNNVTIYKKHRSEITSFNQFKPLSSPRISLQTRANLANPYTIGLSICTASAV